MTGSRPQGKPLIYRLKRAYERSELYKLQQRLKAKRLTWPLYIILSCLLLGGLIYVHYYLCSHIYAVRMDGIEIGLVRNPEEVEQCLEDLTCKCSSLYRLELFPEQDIDLIREYRPGEMEDTQRIRDALMQRLSFLTDAVMITVDAIPVAPVSAAEGASRVIEDICRAYVSEDEGVELLEVEVLEDISGTECAVHPGEIYSAREIASLLTEQKRDQEMLLASREQIISRFGREGREESLPALHVKSLEEITLKEEIPFDTRYISTDKMYLGESRVVSPGKMGLQEVVYKVVRENGLEQSRETLSNRIITGPVSQVVERGTLRRFGWPLALGGRISQGFHAGHRGIDIAVPTNTAVLAAEGGVVVTSTWGSSQGNYIIISHGGYYTLYLHNNKNLVYAGQRVSRGQTIARSGSTGHSTGPHLHFEIRRSTGASWGGWYTHPAINPLQFY